MRLFKRRTSADLEGDPQLTGLRFESGHNQGETKFLSQNSSLDDNISIATAPTPEPTVVMRSFRLADSRAWAEGGEG